MQNPTNSTHVNEILKKQVNLTKEYTNDCESLIKKKLDNILNNREKFVDLREGKKYGEKYGFNW